MSQKGHFQLGPDWWDLHPPNWVQVCGIGPPLSGSGYVGFTTPKLGLSTWDGTDILYEAAWKARESGLFICAYITGKVKHVILDEDFL